MTQRQVAEQLAEAMPGMRWSSQVVGQWETHNRTPAAPVVRALDVILGADGQLARFVPEVPSGATLTERVDELEERVRVRVLEEIIRRLAR